MALSGLFSLLKLHSGPLIISPSNLEDRSHSGSKMTTKKEEKEAYNIIQEPAFNVFRSFCQLQDIVQELFLLSTANSHRT